MGRLAPPLLLGWLTHSQIETLSFTVSLLIGFVAVSYMNLRIPFPMRLPYALLKMVASLFQPKIIVFITVGSLVSSHRQGHSPIDRALYTRHAFSILHLCLCPSRSHRYHTDAVYRSAGHEFFFTHQLLGVDMQTRFGLVRPMALSSPIRLWISD